MALGSCFAPLSTWLVRSHPARLLLDKAFGIDRRRRLPPFARQTFAKWFAARGGRIGHIPDDADSARSVVLFHDTFMTYGEPQIGMAVVRLLEAAGWRVFLPHKRCCGRPMISKGLLDEAISNATYNVEHLYPLAERGFRIVGCEPSCVSAFRDDYLDLLRGDLRKKAERVAAACLTFEEFLADALENGTIALPFDTEGHAPSWPIATMANVETDATERVPPCRVEDHASSWPISAARAGSRSWPRHILLHGHCHQKALFGTDAARSLLARIPGCEVTEIDSGCCGMAGAFGYEKEHYELSRQIGERRLLRAVREADSDTAIVASGTSCRQQIRDLTGKNAYHPAELLALLAL